jgi:type II secretory ATPase GspE/PulE/Tfp pilus assembly ATPase PilB-like protein
MAVSSDSRADALQVQLRFREQLTEIVNRVHGAKDVAEILAEIGPKLSSLLDAERTTVYAVDARSQQIYSLYKEGEDLKEIRVARASTSIVGHVAMTGQTVTIRDAYDAKELAQYHPELRFDASWDKRSGFHTKQVLACPILYEKYLMGVLQLLNKKSGGAFNEQDVATAKEVAKTLGIALYNQRRLAPKRPPNKFGQLVDRGVISEKNFEDAIAYCRMNSQPMPETLVEKYKCPKEEVLASMAAYYTCGSFSFDGSQRMPESYRQRLKHDFLKKLMAAPISQAGGTVQIAIEDPSDLAKVDSLRMMELAPRQELLVAFKKDIVDYLNASYQVAPELPGQVKSRDVTEILTQLSAGEVGAEEMLPEKDVVSDSDSAVVQFANQMIIDAFNRNASDIHVEPYGRQFPTRIRFRVDGDCAVYQEVPATYRAALVSRLKIMANLDISEKRLPQDGKIRFKMGDKTIELRVATLPTSGGMEDVVMRILAASKPLPLEEMGFSERNLKAVKELAEKPYGIILVVGPTGSGKTTTLHSVLGYINTPDIKIWTAEDPVEITQPGLRQVQMAPKINLTFANAMRAFLRADPDVIMVGEMRDQETAAIGVEASLTGHLVLSTLHTNSAPETISRLLDMGIDTFNFADALLGILAQRLLRRICKECRQEYHPSQADFDTIADDYGREYFSELGLVHATYNPEFVLYRGAGCPKCANTGYKGRAAIHELLTSSDAIKRLIQRKAPVEEIRKTAIAEGMRTLMQDGLQKALQGVTDATQVRAVCIK